MDCKRLKADIEKMRDAQGAFWSAIEELEETGRSSGKFSSLSRELAEIEDQILGDHLQEFAVMNPELSEKYTFVGEIEGLEGLRGSFIALGNDKILEYNNPNNSEISIYQKQANGSYEISDIFEPFSSYSKVDLLPNGDILLSGGASGRKHFAFLRKQDDGTYRIEDFHPASSADNSIVLNDGRIMICSEDVSSYDWNLIFSVYQKTQNGYREVLYCDNAYSHDPNSGLLGAETMLPLSNGDTIISDYRGSWGVLRHVKTPFVNFYGELISEGYSLVEQDVKQVFDEEREPVSFAYELPNDTVVLGRLDGEFWTARKDKDGNYVPISKIDKAERLRGNLYGCIQCENGDVLALAPSGLLVPYMTSDSSYRFGEPINGDSTNVGSRVITLHKLANGKIIASTNDGLFYIEQDEDGRYRLADVVEGSASHAIMKMEDLPSGEVICRDARGGFYLLKGNGETSLDLLKKKLSSIASKAVN